MTTSVAVIGAGPAGLAAAYHLASRGVHVHLYEAGDQVGGLARSQSLWGHDVDLGPHVVHGGDPEALALWEELVGDDCYVLPVRRAVALDAGLLEYPPTPAGLIRVLALSTLARAGTALVAARVRRALHAAPDSGDAQTWVVRRYGRPLYDALMRCYLEKLWGIEGTRVDDGFVRALFSARAAGTESLAEKLCRHPRGGTGIVWKRMAERIAERGAVHVGARVDGISVRDGRVTGVRVGGVLQPADHVVSTMPLRHLVRAIGAAPEALAAADALPARDVALVHLLVDRGVPLDHLWVQIYTPRLRMGRVSDTRAWRNPVVPSGVVNVEYWYSDGDDLSTLADSELARLARQELESSGLLPGLSVIDACVTRLRRALPVPVRGYPDRMRIVLDHVTRFEGLHSLGRHGQFAFNSVVDNIASGISVARRILREAPGAGAGAHHADR